MAGGLGYGAGGGVVLSPLDLLIIASTLRRFKKKVFFVDAIAEQIDDFGVIKDLIVKERIGVLIGNLALPTLKEDVEFYKKVREEFGDIKIIVKTGINYKEILVDVFEESGVDVIVFTECDLDIMDYIKKRKKQGSVQKIKGKLKFFPIKERLNKMDLLPVAARDLAKNELYKYVLLPEGKMTTMQTSRGCPFACCYYCPYPLVQGRKWRAMSVKRVIKEIKEIVSLGIKNVFFRDATFTLDMARTERICELLVKKKIKINWWCETRINVLSEVLLKKMKKAGCLGINIGVETMDRDLIRIEGKPGVTLDDVIKIRNLAKKIGVKLHFLMVVGLPDDNALSLYNTFKYLMELNPETMGFTIITPYPGTEMFKQAFKKGLIKNFNWNNFDGSGINMRTKYLSRAEIGLAKYLLSASSYFLKRNLILKCFGIFLIDKIFRIWILLRKK